MILYLDGIRQPYYFSDFQVKDSYIWKTKTDSSPCKVFQITDCAYYFIDSYRKAGNVIYAESAKPKLVDLGFEPFKVNTKWSQYSGFPMIGVKDD